MSIQFAPTWNNASVVQTCIRANATDTASAAASTLIDLSVNGVSQFSVDKTGDVILRESTPQTPPSGYITLYGSSGRLNVINSAGSTTSIIGSINGLTDSTQTFSVGTSGTDFAISSASGVHTFNLPNASATARGVVTTGTQTFAGAKTFSTKVTVPATGNSNGGIGNGANGIDFAGGINTYVSGGGYPTFTSAQSFRLAQNVRIEWSGNNDDAYTAPNTRIERWESGHVSVRLGVISCKLSVTNSFTDVSNYERAILQFVTYASARYAQLACESAGTGIANMNLVLTPKGTGALIAGPVPDGTAVGGNARGANAIDLQTVRTVATQVAGATSSALIGTQSCGIASGATGSVILASTAVTMSTGSYCAVIASQDATVSPNFFCAAIASYGPSIGQVNQSVVLASQYASASRDNQIAFGSGRWVATGDRQSFWLTGGIKTTTNAAVELNFGLGVGNVPVYITLAAGRQISGMLTVQGCKSDGSVSARYCRLVTIRRVSNTTTLDDSSTVGTDLVNGTSLSVTADSTNHRLNVSPTGIFGETWRWQAQFQGIEQAYGT